jgi:hypothetical protein
MNIILIILASNFFTFYFITQNRFPEKWKLNFRPFNCPLCLTAWIAIILYLIPIFYAKGMLVMFSSGSIAPYFNNFMINLYNVKK